jgi:uncharacterized SAM-binding protein YcdF (DUF218 family)
MRGFGASRWRRAIVALTSLALLGAVTVAGAREVGQWLVVADPLASAQAIVVMGGRPPFRAMEAAELYRTGWAPEVWLTRPLEVASETEFRRLGIEVPTEEVYNQRALERLGVPASAIRVLPGRAQNTAQEVRLVADELRLRAGSRVILVTSKAHSRRVRATWQRVVRDDLAGLVRYTAAEPYDPQRWWRHTQDASVVAHEVVGLLNVWVGFLAQPRS